MFRRPVRPATHHPKEGLQPLVGRVGTEVFGRARLRDPAVEENDEMACEREGFGLVVCDEEGREARLVVQAEQPLAELETHPGVERAEGLVEEQDARLDGEGARERHALPLAAREL